jgi:DNA-binding LacI/PurR family transcriptional regulator
VHLLGLENPPTALFAYNDMMAIGALRALHDHGMRVPEDFSLVGYDDIAPAAYSIPSLTTICMPKFEIGQEGARLLLAMIQGLSLHEVMVRPLPVNLVVRESTGPVKLS